MDLERRYSELAARERELGEAQLEKSQSASAYALSQECEGLRDHFMRIASRARSEGRNHQQRARRFEELAARAARPARGLETLAEPSLGYA